MKQEDWRREKKKTKKMEKEKMRKRWKKIHLYTYFSTKIASRWLSVSPQKDTKTDEKSEN